MSLNIRQLTITKQGLTLLSQFDLQLNSGYIFTCMGASGCGKSTLLNAIAGHLTLPFEYEGTIELNTIDIGNLPANKRHVGLVFQDDLLFPHLNIWQNLAFALPNSIKGSHREIDAKAALENIQLLELANSYPDEISGGQRARISLIRSLLAEPKLLLLDEPFGKLDKALRNEFREWVYQQIRIANIPAIIVSHDEDDIADHNLLYLWPTQK